MSERQQIIDYFSGEAPGVSITFAQIAYSEQLHGVQHDIWDLHTTNGRWWVITNPTNLYAQDQFPNMDTALTFHIGLSIRTPRSEEPALDALMVEPLLAPWRALEDASDAVRQVAEVEDCQAIGARCREVLLSMVHAAQNVVPAPSDVELPKRSDFNAWCVIIADAIYQGATQRDRRQLLKTVAKSAWEFVSWLTHVKSAAVGDAEAAYQATEFALTLYTTALTRFLRGVPPNCPHCGSLSLSRQRARNPEHEDQVFERPTCLRCGWLGEGTMIATLPIAEAQPPAGECQFIEAPLTHRKRPWTPDA